MANRTTSTTQRAPPPPTTHQAQTQPTQAQTHQTRRNLLNQSLSRRLPISAAPSRSRSLANTHDPTPSRSSRRTIPTSIEGTDELVVEHEHGEEQSDDSDIIVSRPALLPGTSHTGTSQHDLPDVDAHVHTNAAAMAEALLDLRSGHGHVEPTTTVLPGTEVARARAETEGGNDGTAALIAMYRRRERDREQFDQEEVKSALWESLRRKVKGLEEDRWMFEVDKEVGEGDGG